MKKKVTREFDIEFATDIRHCRATCPQLTKLLGIDFCTGWCCSLSRDPDPVRHVECLAATEKV